MTDHRSRVGGLWNEIGKLQFEFMVSQGLKPKHKLLDIGCGCLRGGVHFIKYLNEGNYYGIDKDADLLKAGKREAKMIGLGHKLFYLELDGEFKFDQLNATFDFAIAQSLFTHLNLNEILLCLINIEKVISDKGKFFATYFRADKSEYGSTMIHQSKDGVAIQTKPAFSRSMHYCLDMLQWAAWHAGLECVPISDWSHPRLQEMVVFYK